MKKKKGQLSLVSRELVKKILKYDTGSIVLYCLSNRHLGISPGLLRILA